MKTNANTKRTTIYLDPELHRALRVKAAETEHSMSELVEEAIRVTLTEDAVDLAAFDARKKERSLAFEEVLKRLKKSGKI